MTTKYYNQCSLINFVIICNFKHKIFNDDYEVIFYRKCIMKCVKSNDIIISIHIIPQRMFLEFNKRKITIYTRSLEKCVCECILKNRLTYNKLILPIAMLLGRNISQIFSTNVENQNQILLSNLPTPIALTNISNQSFYQKKKTKDLIWPQIMRPDLTFIYLQHTINIIYN